MVMLSELLRFHVIDSHGKRARLVDVAIGPLDTDYPAVTQLLYRHSAHTTCVLPWAAVADFSRQARTVSVEDLGSGQSVSHNWPNAVWLGRDVLDAIIVNLRRRHATLANDLLLAGGQKGLRLRAAATGVCAILRRVTGGRFGALDRHSLDDWIDIEFLRGDPSLVRSSAHYHRRITRLPAGQIAHLAEPLPYPHAAELLELLPRPLAADTLEVMPIERQLQIFEELEDERALTLVLPHLRILPDDSRCLTRNHTGPHVSVYPHPLDKGSPR